MSSRARTVTKTMMTHHDPCEACTYVLKRSQETFKYHFIPKHFRRKLKHHSKLSTASNQETPNPSVCLHNKTQVLAQHSIAIPLTRERGHIDHRSSPHRPRKFKPKNSSKPRRIFMGGSLSFFVDCIVTEEQKGNKRRRKSKL